MHASNYEASIVCNGLGMYDIRWCETNSGSVSERQRLEVHQLSFGDNDDAICMRSVRN